MNPKCIASNELSLYEADELLVEVCLESESSGQSSLFNFAELLRNLIAFRQNQMEGKSELELNALTGFIFQGLDEVRLVMGADIRCFKRIELLSEQAIDSWGAQIDAARESKAVGSNTAWNYSPEPQCELDVDTDGSIQAPSADAIRALMSQLGASMSKEAAPQKVLEAVSLIGTKDEESCSNSATGVQSLDPELREAFMDDASACLGSIENALLRLESNRQDPESLAQILRELHTLKGASGSVGLTALADQLHQLEDGLRDDQAAGKEPSIDNLLANVEHIRACMGGSSVTNPQIDSPSAVVRAVTTSTHSAKSPVFSDDSSDGESVRVKSSQLNRLMDMMVELVMLRNQRQTELTVLQEVYHELITCGSKMRLLSNDKGLCSDSSTSLQLSEVASDVLETAQQVRDCTRPFAEGNAAVSRFIRQFRQELVELRRTPISGLFRRLQLVAREAARAESKQVRLALTGEDAGIERALQQRLYEPLLHILRNAIGHGIESPEDRVKNGKNSEGVVTLEAISGPNLFVIEVRDDGSGLDYEAIRRRGVERKLIAADQVVNREELSQLIFHPGFSTRESANQIGGRGVGMDVVASTVQRMRGWLEVTSEPGQGTQIRLSIPLPSVIQHAMVFRCADQLFALSMESVKSAGDLSREIPRTSFAQLLGLETTQANGTDQTIVIADDHIGTMQGKASLALFVDEIIGPEELVVRPLPSLLKHHPYCVGATLSGMGRTVILLDARRLLRSQTTLAKSMSFSKTSAVVSGTKPSSKRPRVLVVDDSLSARKRVVRSLSRYPLDIVEASDGKEALESLKKQHFAAVFSDMEMPNVDGMELLANICASGRSDSPPVVIISSRSEREFTERARQLGAANYLIKPLADEELDAALLRLATLSHLVRDLTLNESEKLS